MPMPMLMNKKAVAITNSGSCYELSWATNRRLGAVLMAQRLAPTLRRMPEAEPVLCLFPKTLRAVKVAESYGDKIMLKQEHPFLRLTIIRAELFGFDGGGDEVTSIVLNHLLVKEGMHLYRRNRLCSSQIRRIVG